MSSSRNLVVGGMVIFAVMSIAAFAQLPTAPPPRRAHPAKAPRQEPCWEQAGVSRGALQQRRGIEQRSRAEIQSVCANGSLTPQQRREQMRSIHERTRQQVDTLISPQQREAIKACQEARGHNGEGFHGGGGGGRGEGPCGELHEPRERRAPASEPQP
jgi:hypothetical protein